jgi:hypothetical protein
VFRNGKPAFFFINAQFPQVFLMRIQVTRSRNRKSTPVNLFTKIQRSLDRMAAQVNSNARAIGQLMDTTETTLMGTPEPEPMILAETPTPIIEPRVPSPSPLPQPRSPHDITTYCDDFACGICFFHLYKPGESAESFTCRKTRRISRDIDIPWCGYVFDGVSQADASAHDLECGCRPPDPLPDVVSTVPEPGLGLITPESPGRQPALALSPTVESPLTPLEQLPCQVRKPYKHIEMIGAVGSPNLV